MLMLFVLLLVLCMVDLLVVGFKGLLISRLVVIHVHIVVNMVLRLGVLGLALELLVVDSFADPSAKSLDDSDVLNPSGLLLIGIAACASARALNSS